MVSDDKKIFIVGSITKSKIPWKYRKSFLQTIQWDCSELKLEKQIDLMEQEQALLKIIGNEQVQYSEDERKVSIIFPNNEVSLEKDIDYLIDRTDSFNIPFLRLEDGVKIARYKGSDYSTEEIYQIYQQDPDSYLKMRFACSTGK